MNDTPLFRRDGQGTLFFLGIFSLPFAAIGGFVFSMAFWTSLSAFRMQDWPTVLGTLSNVELQQRGKSSSVKAEYSYQVDGKEYSGHRVSLYGADNIGQFQNKTFELLRAAFDKHEKFPVHVNPSDPTDSILLPTFRPEILGFMMIFVLAFGGIGFGLLSYAARSLVRLRKERALEKKYPREPWKHKLEWEANKIPASQGVLAFGLGAAALVWNAVAFPLLFLIPGQLEQGKYGVLPLAIFPLAGIVLAYFAVVLILRARRFRGTYFSLETMPGRLGQTLKGKIVSTPALAEAEKVKLKLECRRRTRVRRNGKTTFDTEVLWQHSAEASVSRMPGFPGDSVVRAEFKLPEHQPPSAARSQQNEAWVLRADATLKGANFSHEFELPVVGTGR